MKEANFQAMDMDKELETYTEQAVSNFTYRSGVFGRGLWHRWMTAWPSTVPVLTAVVRFNQGGRFEWMHIWKATWMKR